MNYLKVIVSLLITSAMSVSVSAADYLISTPNTSLLISANTGEKCMIQYYGVHIDNGDIKSIYDSGQALNQDSYPTFGLNTMGEKAMAVTHPNGDMSLDLAVQGVKEYSANGGKITEVDMKDKVYPFVLKQYFKAYDGTDIISTWVKVENNAGKPITLYKFASVFLPVHRGDNWITHLHGIWASEHTMVEEPLNNGQKVISNKDGTTNTETDNPTFMLTLDGAPHENSGHVIGGALAWTGNYLFKFDVHNWIIDVAAGINEEESQYTLEPKETFETPEFALTFSSEGKGGVSRAFHKWARTYKLLGGDKPRDILLNSWEGVYFKVNQDGMDKMMKDFSELGGELFVMDDGWFGNKYPRNDGTSSLGDWEVCKAKLPQGVEGLTNSAKKYGIKFGIWIEPEMTDTKSELYEKHPDWVLHIPNRPLTLGRGKAQIVLDMTNPKVQEHVFNVVDNLMKENPSIAYMKWDCNASLMDYGSPYLPKDKQSHLYIDYHRGLHKVLERIRAKYPDLVMQACAGGGARINYGMLPFFNEYWTSDDTDALQRIYMQWGISQFYPAIGMAAHVSASPNHQTGRVLPLKFRFDVAMSGRLGMEMQPSALTDVEKAFAKRAIAAYKEVRPLVQFGDLYRLISPYDNKGVSSLMYVSPNKDRAVVYIYKLNHFKNMVMPDLRLAGIDANKTYRINDLTPQDENKPCSLNGKTISGKILMEEGITLINLLPKEYSSLALELTEM